MMRRILFISVFILLSSVVLATQYGGKDVLEEGQTKVYIMPNGYHMIKLLVVSDERNAAKFIVDGKTTKLIKERDNAIFNDGSEIFVGDITINEAGDGKDFVEFYFRLSDGFTEDDFNKSLDSTETENGEISIINTTINTTVFEDFKGESEIKEEVKREVKEVKEEKIKEAFFKRIFRRIISFYRNIIGKIQE